MKSFRRQVTALAAVLTFLSATGRVQADPVSDWNAIANVVLFNTGRPAGANIIDMVYVHIAMFDAANAIDGRYAPFAVRPSNAVPWASVDAAVIAAAYTVLVRFYPDQVNYLSSAYEHSLVDVPNNDAKTRGMAIGVEVAERFLALRAGDGRNAVIPYTFGSGAGVYQLTPGAPAPPATPQTPWIAHLKPFAMLSDSQFRAPEPPALTSDLYARDLNETKRYGVRDSSLRTPEQTNTGLFYVDNPNNQLGRNLRLIVSKHTMSVPEIARFYAQMYVTIGDGVIAAWDSKFHYNRWRPVTAIRAADTDGNPNTEPDTAWLPLATTPGHPEYPAAHGYVTGGFAYALERYFGTSALNITLTSASVPGSSMTYHTYASTDSIVREVINARVYGGMHFRNSVEVGAASARKVAAWVADNFFKPSEVPTANLQLWLRADSGLTLNGSTVSRWADLSGNGNDAIQATPSRQPQLVAAALNGKPVVRFDGVDDKLGFTGTTPMTQFSLFVVLNNHAGTLNNDGNVITFGASGDFAHQWFMGRWSQIGPDTIEMATGYTHGISAMLPHLGDHDQWRNLSIVTTGSIWNTTLQWDEKSAHMSPWGADYSISVPMGDATGSGGGIGGADGVPDGTILAKCDVAEILVYNVALTDSARTVVEQYLAGRYGNQTSLGIPDGSANGTPKAFALEQNYPNPFNPTTGIRFQVPAVSDVRLGVYDILGREVAVLVNERKAAGAYEVKFDGNGLASGVYFYRLTAGSFVQTRRMILIR